MNYNYDVKSIGQRVKMVRIYYNESQAVFANRIGNTQSFLSRTEQGSYMPTDKMIDHIVSIYGVNREWLITGVGKMLDADVEDFTVLPIDNFYLLEEIFTYLDQYLSDNSIACTARQKAKISVYLYQYFSSKRMSDPKEIRNKIYNSVEIILTIVNRD